MVGIDYNKVAKIKEANGKLKEAADYYSRGGNPRRAFELYEEVLSEKTPDREVINDIRKRLVKLNAPKELRELASEARKRGLEKRFVFSIFAIGSFVIALFFTSFSLTGYAVGGLTQESSRWFGLGLFACGLISAFFYFKTKK